MTLTKPTGNRYCTYCSARWAFWWAEVGGFGHKRPKYIAYKQSNSNSYRYMWNAELFILTSQGGCLRAQQGERDSLSWLYRTTLNLGSKNFILAFSEEHKRLLAVYEVCSWQRTWIWVTNAEKLPSHTSLWLCIMPCHDLKVDSLGFV